MKKNNNLDKVFYKLTKWLCRHGRQAKDVMYNNKKKNYYIIIDGEEYSERVELPEEFNTILT